MSLRERLIKAGAILAVVLMLVAPVLDRVVFPEPDPPPSAYPTVRQVFHSQAEGFTQRVVKIDGEHIWSELTLHPHAPGPPTHVHTTFAERFIVAEGEVSLVVNGETKVLHAGEEFLVEPGVAHQPFNGSGMPAIVRGPLKMEGEPPWQRHKKSGIITFRLLVHVTCGWSLRTLTMVPC